MDKTPKGPIHSQKRSTDKKSVKVELDSRRVDDAATPIAAALAALERSKTVAVMESKDGTSRSVRYDAEVLKAFRAMFPAGKEYQFRLAGTVIPIPTDGSGNVLAGFTFSPAVATYPEWAGLAALFDEVNLRKARLTLVGGASSLKNVGFVVGYNPNNISAVPASTSAVTNLSDSSLFSSYATTPVLYRTAVTIPRQRAWAECTVPAVASPPAGCVGSFDIANGGASGTVSSTYLYGWVELHIVLRNRI